MRGGGGQVRWHARSFGVSGDHPGQQSNGYRWPYGPVGMITPFNFPLEIPALQVMGALFMGNKPLAHVDHRWAHAWPAARTLWSADNPLACVHCAKCCLALCNVTE